MNDYNIISDDNIFCPLLLPCDKLHPNPECEPGSLWPTSLIVTEWLDYRRRKN